MPKMLPPRIEVSLGIDRICYLSREPRFNLVLYFTLRDCSKTITLLKAKGALDQSDEPLVDTLCPISSSDVIQCAETNSNRSISVLEACFSAPSSRPRATTEEDVYGFPILTLEPHRKSYITLTTSSARRPYELFFDPSQMLPDHKYRIRFDPTAEVTYWRAIMEDALQDSISGNALAAKPPAPDQPSIRWDVIEPEVTFETRASLPETPKVTVSLSAPSAFSLSNKPPFSFNLTFKTHSDKPITVLAERERVQSANSDIEILDACTRTRVAPDLIDEGNMDGPWQREEFLRLEGTYKENRVLDPLKPYSGLEELKVGSQYVLRLSDGEFPWWSEDTLDEIMEYAGDRGDGSLGSAKSIKLVGGDEVMFDVVE